MVSVVLVAIGFWCWPDGAALARRAAGPSPFRLYRHASPVTGHGHRRRRPALLGSVLGAVLGTVTGAVSGAAVGVAAGVVVTTGFELVRAERAARSARRDLNRILTCVRTLARELRSGAPPEMAVRAAGEAHPGAGEALMADVGTVIALEQVAPVAESRPAHTEWDLARRAGDARPGSGRGARPTIVARLAAGWALSSRHGVPWAALIDALAADLAEQLRMDATRDAQVAGPRFSGYVLAAMPALGLLLGFGMGADPVHVLLATGAGGAMLLVGVVLACAGLLWSARIVRG